MLLGKILSKLPVQLRYFFIRRIFTFSYQLPEGIIFKIADTSEEVEQAFRIIHDGFVERKLMDANEHKLRINKYFALPTTTMIICKYKNEVVATVSVIQDSRFGLPTDEYRDLDKFRKKNIKLVEVSSLAIVPAWRHQKGQLMIPLSKYMWEYVHWYLGSDAIIISTKAYAKDFYRGLFLFEALDDDKIVSFGTVKNAKTVSQILFLKPFLARLEETFKNVPRERSLWELSNHVYPEFKYPDRKYSYASDAIMGPEEFEYFFKIKSKVLENLTSAEKKYLAELYFYDDYKCIIFENEKKESDSVFQRQCLRAPVSCKAMAFDTTEQSFLFAGEVREVSRGGFKIAISGHDLKLGQFLNFEISLNQSEKVMVSTQLRWVTENEIGLNVVTHNTEWLKFINAIEERHPLQAKAAWKKTG